MTRRLARIALGLLAVILTGLTVLLATVDLNRHRDFLQERLSAALAHPVTFAEAHLSLRRGVAISLDEVRIGREGEADPWLEAHRVDVRFDLLSLLRGRPALSQMSLTGPRLQLRFAATDDPEAMTGRRRWEDLQVRTITVIDGQVNLLDARGEKPFHLRLNDLEGRISGLLSRGPKRVQLTGELLLDEQLATFTLGGQWNPPGPQRPWQETTVLAHLQVQDLPSSALLHRYLPVAAFLESQDRTSLSLHLAGSPASGLKIAAEAASPGLVLRLPGLYREPLHFSRLGLRGEWTAGEGGQMLQDLRIALDELTWRGDLSLEETPQGLQLRGDLAGDWMPWDELRQFIPDRLLPPFLAAWLPRLEKGRFQVESVQLDGPLQGLFTGEFPIPRATFRFAGHDLLVPGERVENLSFGLHLGPERLTIPDGRFRFLGGDGSFRMSVADPFGDPELEAQMEGRPTAAALAGLLSPAAGERLRPSGHLPTAIRVSGPLHRLGVELRADLRQTALGPPDQGRKPEGWPGELQLFGEITPSALVLQQAKVSIPPLDLRAHGHLAFGEQNSFDLTLSAADLDLTALHPIAPPLRRFDVGGMVNLYYHLSGSNRQILQHGGEISLRGVGLHPTSAIAPLSDIRGVIDLGPEGARGERLSGRLGSSFFSASARLRSFAEPALEILMESAAIHASDLIFPATEPLLRQVAGNLTIDAEAVRLEEVRLRLDGGTEALVRGTIGPFRAPEVHLQIASPFGNIDEVIALWRRPPQPAEEEAARGRGVPVLITVEAERGIYHGLRFHQASGTITHQDRILTIHPLQFQAAAGSASGSVVLDRAAAAAPLLKISGEMENLDVATVHLELLQRRSLISGTLTGRFHLEGPLGADFLPEASGSLQLEVKDGVLQRFGFISKVFSLLNVSQILRLRLPDMAREGMPFQRLSGILTLQEGRLSTENLTMKSPAMNLSLLGDFDLEKDRLNLIMGVKPLQTVDKIVTHIPVAGWILAGEEKALVTAHFQITGRSGNPEVTAIPVTSLSEKTLGIFRRVLGLPGKMISELGELLSVPKQEEE